MLQKCFRFQILSLLGLDHLILSALWQVWSLQLPLLYYLNSHKREYRTAVWEGKGASTEPGPTNTSWLYLQVAFHLMPSIPRGPLRQPQPLCEVTKNTKRRMPRSSGGEACFRQVVCRSVTCCSPFSCSLRWVRLACQQIWPRRQEHRGHQWHTFHPLFGG